MMFKALQLFLLLVIFTQQVFAEATTSDNDALVTKTLLWPDGTRYVGGVRDGKRTGKGTIFWQDGTRFVGTFVDDQRNGPGTMILPDGTVYNGYFENDTLVERSESVAQSEPSAPIAEISAADVPSMPAKTVATIEATNNQVVTNDEPSVAEPAQAVQPSEVPAEAIVEAILTPEMRREVQAAVDLWAAAWSDQNVEQYLGAYSTDFEVPGRQSRRQWEGLRRSRLTRPSRIEVNLVYETFELIANNRIAVDFNQLYDSNLYSDKTNKRLILKKEEELWRIVSEQSR
jgi:hypothetical protein